MDKKSNRMWTSILDQFALELIMVKDYARHEDTRRCVKPNYTLSMSLHVFFSFTCRGPAPQSAFVFGTTCTEG